MPSVALVDNNNVTAADMAGFRRCWNDSQPIIAARGMPLQPITLAQSAQRLRLRSHRTYRYDESDTGGSAWAGFLHLMLQHPEFEPDGPDFLVSVLVAAVRHEAGEPIADTRQRFRRCLLRCLGRMALDAQQVEQNRGITIHVNYTLVAAGPNDGYLTAMRTFVEEMAANNGQAPTESGGVLFGSVTPAQIIAGITGLVA